MAEIRIDQDKAERMIAQILRDEQKMLPTQANELAANICRRLKLAMPAPTIHSSQQDRLISPRPAIGSDFAKAAAKKLKETKDDPALFPEELWRLVYDSCRDVPR
jgi:hypothetical protein